MRSTQPIWLSDVASRKLTGRRERERGGEREGERENPLELADLLALLWSPE